jgi:hypothetical protein
MMEDECSIARYSRDPRPGYQQVHRYFEDRSTGAFMPGFPTEAEALEVLDNVLERYSAAPGFLAPT